MDSKYLTPFVMIAYMVKPIFYEKTQIKKIKAQYH